MLLKMFHFSKRGKKTKERVIYVPFSKKQPSYKPPVAFKLSSKGFK